MFYRFLSKKLHKNVAALKYITYSPKGCTKYYIKHNTLDSV